MKLKAKAAPKRTLRQWSLMLFLLSLFVLALLLYQSANITVEAAGKGLTIIEPSSISLGLTNGGFGGDAIGLAKGDFNGDGKLDVAVTVSTNVPNVGNRGSISILLGNGDGSFQTPSNIPIPDDNSIVGFAYGILARDFDRDGVLDLVVSISEQHRVLFLKGHGNGTFDNPVGFSTVDRSSGVQTSDLNGDGFLDLVTFNPPDHSVSVLLGNGNGTFQAASVYGTNINAQGLALVDLNGATGLDIVVGCYGDGNNQPSIDVLLNNGSGVFPASATRFNLPLQVLGLYASDFDGDGKVDVVATGYGGPLSRSLVFIKGNGDGTFVPPTDQNYQVIEDNPVGSARFSENTLTDLNGDGRLDLLIDHSGAFNIVTVALSRGDGHFDIQELVASNGPGFAKDAQNNIPTADGNPTNATIAGDLNGDGKPDLIVACGQAGGGTRAGGLAILPGSGPGKFLAPRVFPFKNDLHFHSNFSYAGNNDRSTALGDFNGDGKPDLITLLTGGEGDAVSGPAHLAEVLPGNGDGTFGAAIVALGGTSGLGTGATTVRVADMNRDGKLDVIVTSGPAGVQGNQGTTATRIAFGVGNGTFNYAVELPPADPGYSIPNVIVADFNGDGAPDLAVLTTRATDCCGGAFNHIEVFLQQSGAFVRTAGFPETDLGDTRSNGIAAADLDGDGHTDLIAAGLTAQQDNQLFFFHGNNNGTFQAPVAVGAITLAQARIGDIRVVDLNHDNIPDIVATGFGGVGIYLGTGGGHFQTPVLYGSGGGGVAVLDIADLDGDGNPDLALGSTNGFTILRGIGDGTFANAPSYFAIGYLGARNVRIGDLNGDGKPDLVVGHDGSSAENLFATVLLNNYPAVQFSATNYSVGEAGPSAVVTVTRTGDASAGCTVDYSTSDTAGANPCDVVNGVASSRCDYITTLGTLTFAPNELSKNINLPIIDDLYVEGPETFTITLSNPNLAVLGSPTSATVTIVDNDTVNPTTNPIDDAGIFVRQHYIDFLNREPDSGGLNFWTNEITSCGSNAQCIEVKRINVSAAFFLSIEFQETGYQAYCTYKSAFGNVAGTPVPVRFNDFLRDTQALGQGVQVGIGNWQAQLEANKQVYALAFVQRPEFLTAYPNTLTATQLVTQMDTNAGTVLSPTEKADLIAVLGTTPADVSKRATVLRSVSENSTLRSAEFNRAFVLMEYFGYLRRNPNDAPDSDFSGYNFWLNKLNSFGGNFVNAEMVKAFILSGEYRHRLAPS